MAVVAEERKQSALEIQIRELFKNPENVKDVEGEGYQVTAVDAKGRTWFGSRESYCRRALRQGMVSEVDEEETIFDAVRVGEEGSDESYLLTVVNTAVLKDVEFYGKMYISASAFDDHDVQTMLDDLTDLLGLTFELPTDDNAVVSRIEFLIAVQTLLKNSKTEDADGKSILMFDRETNMVTELTDISLQHHPFAGPYLHLNHGATALFGANLVDVSKNSRIWEARIHMDKVQFVVATPELIEKSAARGRELFKKFTAPEGFVHIQYEGNTYTPDMFGNRVAKFTKSRVVIDPKGCQLFDTRTFNGLMELEGITVNTNNKDEIKGLVDPADEKFAQVQPCLVVFNLTTSRWALGNVSAASEVVYRKDAFEKVILAPVRKRLVRALASFHNQEGANIDIIAGKGGGNLFLLDGAPGTGKTLTAEATAEELGRILYKVSLGELGSSVERLESALNRILSLAERWNAVLLIDEADVFLEKRTSENLARNAVVAVFLRLLEYFGGLLFMTTNRGDNLDEAFLSRVTLALHFKKPDEEGQTAIWNGLLKNAGVKLTVSDIEKLVQYGVNGREIKNAINTGRALAAQDGKPLGFLHIDEVLRTRAQFFKEVEESVGTRG